MWITLYLHRGTIPTYGLVRATLFAVQWGVAKHQLVWVTPFGRPCLDPGGILVYLTRLVFFPFNSVATNYVPLLARCCVAAVLPLWCHLVPLTAFCPTSCPWLTFAPIIEISESVSSDETYYFNVSTVASEFLFTLETTWVGSGCERAMSYIVRVSFSCKESN